MVRIYLLLLFPYLVFILCYVMYVRNLHEIKTKNVTECYCMKTRVSYVIPCMITTLMEFFFVFKWIYICFIQSQIHTLIITMQVFSIDKRNFFTNELKKCGWATRRRRVHIKMPIFDKTEKVQCAFIGATGVQ